MSACEFEQTVLNRLESMTGEMLEFLRELIRIPTVNPPGDNYRDCAELIGSRLREFGYEVSYIEAEGRPEHTARHPRVNVIGCIARMGPRGLYCISMDTSMSCRWGMAGR